MLSARPRRRPADGVARISLPRGDQAVMSRSFNFAVDKNRVRKAEPRDGHRKLRSNLEDRRHGTIHHLNVGVPSDAV